MDQSRCVVAIRPIAVLRGANQAATSAEGSGAGAAFHQESDLVQQSFDSENYSLVLLSTSTGVMIPATLLYLGQLQFRPLEDAQPRAEVYMVSRSDNDNPALPTFLRMAQDYFRTIGLVSRYLKVAWRKRSRILLRCRCMAALAATGSPSAMLW